MDIQSLIGKTIVGARRFSVDFMAPHRLRMGELIGLTFSDETQSVMLVRNDFDTDANAIVSLHSGLEAAAQNFPYSHHQVFTASRHLVWDSESGQSITDGLT